MTFNENLSDSRLDNSLPERDDPCLAYHDTVNKINCALCKPGSIRIVVNLSIDTSESYKFVFCGSARKPDRNDVGVYEYLDPDALTQDVTVS